LDYKKDICRQSWITKECFSTILDYRKDVFSTKLGKQSDYSSIFYSVNQKDGRSWRVLEKMEYVRSEEAWLSIV
jgi:hypothetical protein